MRWIAALCASAGLVAHAADPKLTIVVCSPGSPGSTEDAKAAMDAFASAVSAKAGVPLAVIYDPSEDAGAGRLKESGIGIVSLPFFLKHEKDLALHARLEVVQKGRPALDRWALAAQKGRVKRADALAGFTITSNAAFAPGFVRGAVAAELGAVPANVQLMQSTAVLSALRRAADGEASAVLLDGPQTAALASLPFAAKLEVVARSPEMPVALVVTIDARVPDKTWSGLAGAFLGLASDPNAATALDGVHISKFGPVEDKPLAAARQLYATGAATEGRRAGKP